MFYVLKWDGIKGIKEALGKIKEMSNVWQIIFMTLFIAVVAAVFIVFLVKFTKKNEEYSSTKRVALTSVFSALSLILMLFGIAIFPQADFLKVEVSFVVIFLVAKVVDLKSGIIVAFVTATLDYLIKGSNVAIPLDQMLYFIATVSFLLPVYFFDKKQIIKSNGMVNFACGLALGVLVTTTVMLVLNYTWSLPIYYNLYGLWPYKKGVWIMTQDSYFLHVIQLYGAFNLIKWGSVAVISGILYPTLLRVEKAIQQ